MKNKFTILLLLMLLIFLVGCTNEPVDKVTEIKNDFTVDEHIKSNFLYQQSSTLRITGKCEAGAVINATLYNQRGIKVFTSSTTVNKMGMYDFSIKTPFGSYETYELVISDSYNKFPKKYSNLVFGEIILLLGDYLINAPITEELTFEEEEKLFDNAYFMNASNQMNSWLKVTSKDQVSGFMYSLFTLLSSSSKFDNMPIGYVSLLFNNTKIEEWLPLHFVKNNMTVNKFLIDTGKYYENPYQVGQMSYVCNNLLSKYYNYSFGNIIFSSGVNEFSEFYGIKNNDEYYNVYSKMLLTVLRNIKDNFYKYNSLSLIQTGSVDVDNISKLRDSQNIVSNYIDDLYLIPTYDLAEDEAISLSDEVATRYYDIAIAKKQISKYANYYINETEKKIVIEFSNTTSFIFSNDSNIIDVNNLRIYDKNGQEIIFKEDKIDVNYNRITIYLSYELDDILDEEDIEQYYEIGRISYAQDSVLTGNFVYNVNNLPIVPFEIIID